MLTYSVDMDSFLSTLRDMVNSVVVKRTERASEFETVQIRTNADKYISILDGNTSWASFAVFDYDVLINAGMSDSLARSILATTKDNVPFEFRELVCRLQAEKIIANYVEENEYYRILNGEPPIGTTEDDYVYMPKNEFGIPTDIPIHLLNEGYLEYFNSSGLREKIYEENKDKPYLLYLGTHRINYYRARTASNYEIIYIEPSVIAAVTDEFQRNYVSSRNYVVYALYNKSDQRLYEHYDSFMGFVIITMAVQRTFTSIFKQGITRDFYDDSLIRHLFAGYNIPYIESIDVGYQRDIAKKLNILLQKKSSNAVLFDIVSLFNYNNVNIYKYYLMRDFYKDEQGNPVFIYKTIYDENNQPHEVLDYEKTYDIYFQKVNIRSKDQQIELYDKSNRIEYGAVCGDDPYWIEDSDLLNKLYTSKFNATLTKYMSIDVSYELAKLMYETSYGIRMMLDDNEDYKKISIALPYTSENVSLYDTVVFLCALVAKKFNLAGNVPLQPYQIAQVYGFNFKTDIDMLRDKIMNDIDDCHGEYRAVREELLSYLKTLNASTIEGAKNMYNDIDTLRVWLDKAMRYSNSIEEYEAYRKIYKSCLVTRDTQELYTKNDGTFAHTFAELLQNRRPDLYEVLNDSGNPYDKTNTSTEANLAAFSINNKVNLILGKLADIAEGLRDLQYMNDKEAIVNNIEKIINQFKSYTVDQLTSNITYLINDPHMCLLKILDTIAGASSSVEIVTKINLIYMDVLDMIAPKGVYCESAKFNEALFSDKIVAAYEIIKTMDELHHIHKVENLDSLQLVYDAFHRISKQYQLPDEILSIREKYESQKQISEIERIKFIDYIAMRHANATYIDKTVVYDANSSKNVHLEFGYLLTILNHVLCEIRNDMYESFHLRETLTCNGKKGDIDLHLSPFDVLRANLKSYDKAEKLGDLHEYIWSYNSLSRLEKIKFDSLLLSFYKNGGTVEDVYHLFDTSSGTVETLIKDKSLQLTDKLYKVK